VNNRQNAKTRLVRLVSVGALAASTSIFLMAPVEAATKKPSKTAVKKSVKTSAPTTAARNAGSPTSAFDVNNCTYVDAATVSRVTGVAVKLDTSTGDTGFNAHLRSGAFEQCIFVPEAATANAQTVAIIHVNINDAGSTYELAHAGDISTGTYCPAACADIAGLGDAAFVSTSYGVGGGAGGGSANVMSRLGHAYVLVGAASQNPGVKSAKTAADLDPRSVSVATELNRIVLANLGGTHS
jgi:hypothetical protein